MAKAPGNVERRPRKSGWANSAVILTTSLFVFVGAYFVTPATKNVAPTVPAQQVAATTDLSNSILAHFNANIERPSLKGVNAVEGAVGAITNDVLEPWQQSWRKQDAGSFTSLVAPEGQVADLARPLTPPVRTISTVAQHRWNAGAHAMLSGNAVSGMVQGYLSQFSKIADFTVDVESVKLTDGGKGATLLVSVDLRGVDKSGARRQDRGLLNLTCLSSSGTWKISNASVNSMETLTCRQPAFAEVTKAVGLDKVNIYQRIEAIRRGGYAVAVGDYDRDGNLDVFVGSWGPCQLFRNMGNGTYSDVTAQVGLANVTMVKAAAFLDVRNNGSRDLVLSRFTTDQNNDVVMYFNKNGKFERSETPIARTTKFDRAMPMALADYNNDSFLDLYVGFPGKRDFTVTDMSPQKLAPQGLFMNNGKGSFTDNTKTSGLNDRLAATLPTFPHASVAADFDGDGQMDLLVVDDRRNRSPVYRNVGNAKFVDVSKSSGINNAGWGMGVAVGDYDGDALPDIYVTNVDFTAAKRVAAIVGKDAKSVFTGNHLYRNLGAGKFEDVTAKAGVGWAGQGAGGCVWLDYNNDGKLDLYVVNGLWSGASRKDFSSTFVRNFVAEMLAPSRMQASVSQSDATAMSPKDPDSTNLVMKFLSGYHGQGGQDATLSMAGYQRHRMFHNNGNGTFTEVGYLAGVDNIEDGYVAATADMNKDGKMDLVLRNADPGVMEYQYPCITVLQNQFSSANHSLNVYLKGDGIKSNRDAVGAVVTIWANGKKQVREITALNGASQSEMSVFFGLGKADHVDRMQVRWPSGKVQAFTNVQSGRATIEEGKGIATI